MSETPLEHDQKIVVAIAEGAERLFVIGDGRGAGSEIRFASAVGKPSDLCLVIRFGNSCFERLDSTNVYGELWV